MSNTLWRGSASYLLCNLIVYTTIKNFLLYLHHTIPKRLKTLVRTSDVHIDSSVFPLRPTVKPELSEHQNRGRSFYSFQLGSLTHNAWEITGSRLQAVVVRAHQRLAQERLGYCPDDSGLELRTVSYCCSNQVLYEYLVTSLYSFHYSTRAAVVQEVLVEQRFFVHRERQRLLHMHRLPKR